ncbi:hypothetical protein XENOCAPTIV_019715 [Xenoophorus captivus]|uniref:Uncharacterized protein n=1 Tax=Xenoophorus captivus TaxID=1517983 RepID=A0ABV0QMA0_9TELE
MHVLCIQRTKRKRGQKQVLHRLLLVSLVPSGVVWARRCAKTNQTVSITIMSVMGNQTVEMVQMRKICAHGRKCIEKSKVCDGVPQCQDHSDEIGCAKRMEGCAHLCDENSRCIPSSFLCDGEQDCSDGSDEATSDILCSSTEFKCLSAQCVLASMHCDGHPDCWDRSDEEGCTKPPVCTTKHRCPQSKECLILQMRKTTNPFSVAVFNDMLYWSDAKKRVVQAANKLSGKNRQVILKRPGQPFAVKAQQATGLKGWPEHLALQIPSVSEAKIMDYSIHEHTLILTDDSTTSVNSFKLKDSILVAQGQLLKLLDDQITAMALDWVTLNVYWSSNKQSRLHVTSKTGAYTAILIKEGITGVGSIALHPQSGRVCFTNLDLKDAGAGVRNGSGTKVSTRSPQSTSSPHTISPGTAVGNATVAGSELMNLEASQCSQNHCKSQESMSSEETDVQFGPSQPVFTDTGMQKDHLDSSPSSTFDTATLPTAEDPQTSTDIDPLQPIPENPCQTAFHMDNCHDAAGVITSTKKPKGTSTYQGLQEEATPPLPMHLITPTPLLFSTDTPLAIPAEDTPDCFSIQCTTSEPAPPRGDSV